jgi:hypothetical protein
MVGLHCPQLPVDWSRSADTLGNRGVISLRRGAGRIVGGTHLI